MASQISVDLEKSDLLRYGGIAKSSTYLMYVLSFGDASMPRRLTSFAYLHSKLFEVYAYLLSHLQRYYGLFAKPSSDHQATNGDAEKLTPVSDKADDESPLSLFVVRDRLLRHHSWKLAEGYC